MNSESTQKFHIHTKILVTRMAYIAAVMAVVPLILVFTGNESSKAALPALLIIEGMSLLLVFWLMYSYIYVAVSPEGIRYRSLGYQIASSWENIAGIQERFMMNEGQVEGLALKEQGTHVNPALRVGSFISPTSRMAMNEVRDFIPLSILFTADWRETEIGAAIRKYAPHVFENP